MHLKASQRGFILSVEAILIFTILGIGLLGGIVAVRDALIRYEAYRNHNRVVVFDSSEPPVVLGRAAAFDPHETPLVPFIDYDSDPANWRALIGVRPYRFTSRQPVFYAAPNCPANATSGVCLAAPGSDAANAAFAATGQMTETGSLSYLSAMQWGPGDEPGPSYGIGNGGPIPDGQLIGVGVLYRSTSSACTGPIRSVWYSQRVGSDDLSLCVSVNMTINASDGFVEAEQVLDASSNPVLGALTPPFRVNRVTNPGDLQSIPPCPEGTSWDGDSCEAGPTAED